MLSRNTGSTTTDIYYEWRLKIISRLLGLKSEALKQCKFPATSPPTDNSGSGEEPEGNCLTSPHRRLSLDSQAQKIASDCKCYVIHKLIIMLEKGRPVKESAAFT